MVFSPKQKNGGVLTVVIIAIIALSVILYCMPSVLIENGITAPPIWFVFSGLIGFIAAIYLFLRYSMTKFEYVIKPRDESRWGEAPVFVSDASDGTAPLDFVVYKAMGTRQAAMECVLPLSDLIEAVPLKKGERTKNDVMRAYKSEAKGGFIYYDYTLTFFPKETLELVFADGDKIVGIIIEDSNPVAEYLKK